MKTFLGIDGGGTKTDFLLIDEKGHLLASHKGGSAYYLETGLDALQAMLAAGIEADPEAGRCCGIGSRVCIHRASRPRRRQRPFAAPEQHRRGYSCLQAKFRCGNDMVCGWAGALGGSDGINIVAGTGSIAYGEFAVPTGARRRLGRIVQ